VSVTEKATCPRRAEPRDTASVRDVSLLRSDARRNVGTTGAVVVAPRARDRGPRGVIRAVP
jgi:hypothetical protein